MTAQAQDPEYYHPPVTSEETYVSMARVLPESSREERIAVTQSLEISLIQRPFPSRFVMFVAGPEADTLIISVNSSIEMDTEYRARALLQGFTAVARTLPFMQEHNVEDIFTFLDVAKLSGFKTIIVTNGKDFTHRITLA